MLRKKLYEAVLALRIKPLCKTLIPNQIRKKHVRIFSVDWYYFLFKCYPLFEIPHLRAKNALRPAPYAF